MFGVYQICRHLKVKIYKNTRNASTSMNSLITELYPLMHSIYFTIITYIKANFGMELLHQQSKFLPST